MSKAMRKFNLTRKGTFLNVRLLDELWKLSGKYLVPTYTQKRKHNYKIEYILIGRTLKLINITCSNIYYKRKCLKYKHL